MHFRFITIIVIFFSSLISASENISPVTTFYLVRHGQTDWNAEKKIQGQSDIPLNAVGRAEAAQLATELKEIPFAAYFSSDLQRAYETALILTAHRPQPIKIYQDARLKERNFGHWEGHYSSEFYSSGPENKQDVESNEAMQQRALSFLQQTVDQYSGSNILVVTHGGIIRNLILRILNLDCSIDDIQTKNGSILTLTYSNGQWSVKGLQGIEICLH